jgi:transcriptional regulator with XRE-family HTH domain
MQSSVAAQNDLSRSPQGQSDWRAEVESMEELMMTMLKRLQNLAMLRPGNLNIEEGILFQQRALTCLSSATEHDDEKNWLDEIDWKAFGLRLVQKRDAAKMQQKELANLVGVTAQTIRNLEMAAKRPSRELLFRLLAIPELNLKIGDITGEENKPTLIPTSWLAPQYDPQKLMTDMVATLNGSGDALEQTTAYLDSRSAIDFLTIASSREYLGIFSNSAPLQETASKNHTGPRSCCLGDLRSRLWRC